MSAPANTRIRSREYEDEDERAFKYAVDPHNQRVHTTSSASRLATDALGVILQHTHIANQRAAGTDPGTITHADAREQLRLVNHKFNTQVNGLKERNIYLSDKAAFTASYTASFAWIQNWIDTDVRINEFKFRQHILSHLRMAVAYSPPERQFLCLEEPNRRDLLDKPVHMAAREAAFAAFVGETPAMVAQFREIVTREAALLAGSSVGAVSDRQMKCMNAWVDSTNIQIDAGGSPVLLAPNREVSPIEALTRFSLLDVDRLQSELGFGYYLTDKSTDMLRIYVYAMVKSHGIRAARLAVAWICCVQLFAIVPCEFEYDREKHAVKRDNFSSVFKWLTLLFLTRNPDTNELDVSVININKCRTTLQDQGNRLYNDDEIDTILRILSSA